MKKIVLALAIAVATAAAASAQTAAKTPASKASHQTKAANAMKAPAAKPQVMKVEVVSTDAAAKTITFKDASGANVTLTAVGPAVVTLAKISAGDWVNVTEKGTNATKITKVKATPAKKK